MWFDPCSSSSPGKSSNESHQSCPSLSGRQSRSQVLQEAGLPTLSWRRREHCLGLLWKLVNGIGPPTLLNILPATTASRSSFVVRSSHFLQFPLCLPSRHKSSFLCYTIPIWNMLSSSVMSSSSVSSFQCSLRKAFADDKYTWPYLSFGNNYSLL